MNVYYYSSCMETVPFRSVPGVSVLRETPLRSHTHTQCAPFISISLALMPASADADFFIQCSTQSYNLTVILLQHLIKINKCMSLLERSALLTAASLCYAAPAASVCPVRPVPPSRLLSPLLPTGRQQALEQMERDFVAPSSLY